MKAKYLSRAQAIAMRHDFRHLVGQPLEEGKNIEYVTVVPYSRILQWQFVQNLLREGANGRSLSPENPAERYDVLLVARAADTDQGFIAKDLRSYLAARGISFVASHYTCLRSNSISMKVLTQILS